MALVDLGSVFLLGLLGTGHCVGMCGAFALAVSAGAPRPTVVVWRQISYQLGKATSYLFIGVLLLVAGAWLGGRSPVETWRQLLAWAVGLAMVFTGLTYALEWRLPGWLARGWQRSGACGAMAALWSSPSLMKSVLAGWINGFLPCGLSFMAIAYLVGTQSAATLVAGVYVFGLGTLPGLLGVSLVGHRISLTRRRWLMRASGLALIGLGGLTVVRGDARVHAWFHEHLSFSQGSHEHHGH